MWFKNLLVYTFNDPSKMPEQEALSQALSQREFSPCTKLQPSTLGWVAALPEGQELVHKDDQQLLLCAKRQERLLPASVVKEFLDDKVAEIQQEQDRKVGRKEKLDLKDQIIFELLPQAFTRSSLIWVVIDRKLGLLWVASASSARAEEVLKLLRDCLGSLAISPLEANHNMAALLTDCFLGNQSPILHALPEFELKQPGEEEAVLRHRNLGLDALEIQSRLADGWQVTKLSLEYRDKLSLNLDCTGAIKRIKYQDVLMDEVEHNSQDHPSAQAAANFSLSGRILSQLLAELIAASQALKGDNPG